MRQADIDTKAEYAWESFNGLSRVRVVERGVKLTAYHTKATGVRVEHVGGWPFEGRKVVQARDIAPWEERHDKRLEREHAARLRAERIGRVGARLDVAVDPMHSHWVRITDDSLFQLAERLGVDTY